jgi:hypothetical protein
MENQDINETINKQNSYQGVRQNSPMEVARRNSINTQKGFNQNPYITSNAVVANETISTTANPYYNTANANQVPNTAQPKSVTDSLLGTFDTENFIKGALIGAVGAYLLTNETAQKAIFKGVAKTTSMFQAGMEEMKERFEDAKAELEAEQEA